MPERKRKADQQWEIVNADTENVVFASGEVSAIAERVGVTPKVMAERMIEVSNRSHLEHGTLYARKVG